MLGGAVIVVSAAIQRADWREILEMSALLAGSMLFVTALGLPALYRFGAKKGRYVMILIIGVGVGAALGVMGPAYAMALAAAGAMVLSFPGERGILPGPPPGTLRLRRGIVRRE